MPVERIKIAPNEFTTRDAAGNTTFYSGNKYLKTDISSQLLAGGFERAPVINGYGTIADDTTAGGFPCGSIGGSFASYPTHTFTIPFNNPYVTFSESAQQPGVPMNANYVISGQKTYTYNGIPGLGSYYLQGAVYGVPIGSSGQYQPRGVWWTVILFQSLGSGTYTIDCTGPFYVQSTGNAYTANLGQYWKPKMIFATTNPIGLALAVTP